MIEVAVDRGRTAIDRYDFSRPVKLALRSSVIRQGLRVFDYGCGRGRDVELLAQLGITVGGWDPNHAPAEKIESADVVNLGFVINVIEDPDERRTVLKKAFALAQKTLIVSAQMEGSYDLSRARPYKDGYLTSSGTFQKYFTGGELIAFVQSNLGVTPYSIDRGVLLVFKDEAERAQYLSQRYDSSRYRRISASDLGIQVAPSQRKITQRVPATERHRAVLAVDTRVADLVQWVMQRGRLPRNFEYWTPDEFRELGVPRPAVEGFVLDRVGEDALSRARDLRSLDLLVMLALSRFDHNGRPKLSALSDDQANDIKAYFGSYQAACKKADELLFSVGQADLIRQKLNSSVIGKSLPDDLYFHISAVPYLDPVLRVFVGCGQALVPELGEDTIVKLSKKANSVTFLDYPEFETLPHPVLARSTKVFLREQRVDVRDYARSENPPILHRKETMVHPSHPRFSEFEAISKVEESLALLGRRDIGYKKQWQEILEQLDPSAKGLLTEAGVLNHSSPGL